jgi:MFS family permease
MSTTTETVLATELFELQPQTKVTVRTLAAQQPRTSLCSPTNSSSSPDAVSDPPSQPASKWKTFFTVFTPSLVGFLASFTNGVITIGLPIIAHSISLERSLYLWPSSVYGLTSGAALLIAGSIADIVGARQVELLGITLLGVLSLACGFAQTGAQLVAFRALQGIALAMHLPSSVAIITSAVPAGRARNLGFACLGFSQPLGFAVGLVLSGVMIERAGWRSGFYLSGACLLAVAIAAVWTLPKLKNVSDASAKSTFQKVCREIDWIGGLISSGGLAILAYVLAYVPTLLPSHHPSNPYSILSADLTSIRAPTTIALLTLGILLLVCFPLWQHHRTQNHRPALIPNSLWTSLAFTSTCIMVTLSYGVMNSLELFSSLYFQEIQHAGPLTTSLYLLPNLATGVLVNIVVGATVHKLPARWLVACSAMACACSPLIMALMHPTWNYGYAAFWAQVLAPLSADALFTVGLIIVSESFPEDMQALAGAVFNTVAQFGMSLGMGSCQVVALGVQGNKGEGALLGGYRASFWLMVAYMLVCGGIAVVGLRKAGRVGLKRE